jgi:hypothetical protein
LQNLIRQLDRVRGRARVMLILVRASRWLAAVLAVAIVAGFVDYLLRLPPWPRMVLLLAGVAAAIFTAVTRIGRAVRLNPALTSIALRLEALYPQAHGRLASAVAFATEHPHELETPNARAMAGLATEEANAQLEPEQVRRLLNPTHLYRSVGLLALAAVFMAVIAGTAPHAFATATQRWINPFGAARWPNIYAIESRTTQKVAPNNAPFRLAAQVNKGDYPGLRTWVVYRFANAADAASGNASWQRALMTRQSESKLAGLYQLLLEPSTSAGSVEFYFEAGDDATEPQKTRLIQPPTLRRLVAQIDPPAYAKDLIAPQRQDLLQPPRPAVSIDALEGSRIRLTAEVDGSFENLSTGTSADESQKWIARNLVGIVGNLDPTVVAAMGITALPAGPANPGEFEVTWTLRATHQFHLSLSDQYATSYDDQRVFRFEARPDRAPRATILEPAGDESVLATAVVPLKAEAFDDVAVSRLDLVARPPKAEALPLGSEEKMQPKSGVAASLDLAPLKLKTGDEVAVVAIVRDNYSLDGKSHDPVESPPRKIKIISPDELTRQIRTDIAELRQRAMRAKGEQEQLTEAPADNKAAAQQQEVGERVGAMERTIQQLQQRIEANRFKDEGIDQTLKNADKNLKEADKESQKAAGELNQAAQNSKNPPAAVPHEQKAREAQKQTVKQLQDLVELLDQGRDAYELKQKLVKLSKDQEDAAKKVRETSPQTLGKTSDQLSDKDKQDLAKEAQEQKNLAEQAKDLLERMRATAAALGRQSDKIEDQATAEAMRQAAAHAAQEDLQKKMEQASEQVKQNQLNQAQSQQADAQQIIQEMLQQLGKTDQLKAQILQRKLQELVEAIRKLRDTQAAQLDRLKAAEKLDELDQPLLTLRRNTQSVAEDARATDKKTEPIAKKLDEAAASQSEAVAGLRAQSIAKPAVEKSESAALDALEDALKLAQDLAEKAGDDMAKKDREELVKAYAKALAEQKAILAETKPLVDVKEADRDRKHRAAALALGNREADLRVELTKLSEKLADTVVYKSVHEQMDQWAAESSTALRRGQPQGATVVQEQLIAMSIEALIEALKPEKPGEEFAEDQGGGGGGGGGKPPLIPPVAELKLLRTRQTQLHDMTRVVDGATDASGKSALPTISRQQKDLADVGAELIQKLTQQQQPRGVGDGLPPGAEKIGGDKKGDKPGEEKAGPVKPDGEKPDADKDGGDEQ